MSKPMTSLNVQDAPAFGFGRAIKSPRARIPPFMPIDAALATELAGRLLEDFSPEGVLLNRETPKEVLSTLELLGPLTRDIFILFQVENMKQKDIAALYGIDRSAVEKHVLKAVAFLAARHCRR